MRSILDEYAEEAKKAKLEKGLRRFFWKWFSISAIIVLGALALSLLWINSAGKDKTPTTSDTLRQDTTRSTEHFQPDGTWPPLGP